jgi:hypothetical protein
MATSKKVTRVEGGAASPEKTPKWTPTAEAKSKAAQNRLIAAGLWILAILAQIVGILILVKNPTPLTTGLRVWLIVALVIDLIFLIFGSSFWKKANRLDPASKQNALAFTVQSQAGVGVAVLAFLPVVILAFIKKEYIVGAIAALFMVGGGAASADYNAPSVEEYTEQTNRVEELTGKNEVYWTKSGTKYHLYDDCQHINSNKTEEIFEGTVAQARELKNITELCKTCENRAEKAKALNAVDVPQVADGEDEQPQTEDAADEE